MIIITGASNNHFKTLGQFLDSIIKFKNNIIEKVIVYDLDISVEKWDLLQKTFNESYFIFKQFDYKKYPEWYNININAGEYAWKPAIIYECSLEHKDNILVWMDAGTLITTYLDDLNQSINNTNLHSGTTGGTIQDWTYYKTIEMLKPRDISLQNRNGSCLGFNCKQEWVTKFITEFYTYSTNKECIAPEGSSRKNHRQDQALFTILYYKYKDMYNFTEEKIQWKWNIFLGYTIHNDIGGSHNPC